MKPVLQFLATFLGVIGAVVLFGWTGAVADPVRRETQVALTDWPAGAPPIRVALLSDLHVGTSTMRGTRLNRIVDQVNAAKPDLIMIAGDFIHGDHVDTAKTLGLGMIAPLRRLRAPLGVVAVPGNHDYWTGLPAVRAELAAAGVTLLENSATRRGPLAIGGIADEFTGHQDVAATYAALDRTPGARVLLTHSPDIAPDLPPGEMVLLAGHTHCGQLRVPLLGPLIGVSRYGDRFGCGVRREGNRTVVTTGGLGTSGPPLRYFAPADFWIVTFGPGETARVNRPRS